MLSNLTGKETKHSMKQLCRTEKEFLSNDSTSMKEKMISTYFLHEKVAGSSGTRAKILPVADGTKWTCLRKWLKWFSKP